MSLVYRRLKRFDGTAFIIGTFHDELLVECDEADAKEVLEIIKTSMLEAMDGLNAGELKVPIKVTGGTTKSWSKD
jgi:DNA polymerase I-like protein with 3'-5' exonuclease and polymerase domains